MINKIIIVNNNNNMNMKKDRSLWIKSSALRLNLTVAGTLHSLACSCSPLSQTGSGVSH